MLNAYQQHLLKECNYEFDVIANTLWYHLALGYHTAYETVEEIIGKDANLNSNSMKIVTGVLLSMYKAEEKQKENDTSN